jgi:hypothetical protein
MKKGKKSLAIYYYLKKGHTPVFELGCSVPYNPKKYGKKKFAPKIEMM